MYTQTRSKTVAEATHKLFRSEVGNSVVSRTVEQLTDIQRECLGEYLEDLRQYTEDVKLALENLYGNLDNSHLYVLEVADDYDDSIQYYYCELTPLTTLYKDDNGNLWCYEGFDEESKMHQVTVVDEEDGFYTNTSISWYMTNEEFSNCTKIEVEV